MMSVKYIYQSPVCDPVCCEMKYSLLTGGSQAKSTAMTISLIDFGDGAITDGEAL